PVPRRSLSRKRSRRSWHRYQHGLSPTTHPDWHRRPHGATLPPRGSASATRHFPRRRPTHHPLRRDPADESCRLPKQRPITPATSTPVQLCIGFAYEFLSTVLETGVNRHAFSPSGLNTVGSDKRVGHS